MTTLAQRSFAGGELAPALYARCDTLKYQTGLRTMRNFFTASYGGAINRPGTQFCEEVKDSSKIIRQVKFVFSQSQAYILELGNIYMRVLKNGAYILKANKTVVSITKATQAVVTITGHGYTNGQQGKFTAIAGMTELANQTFIISDVTTDTFKIKYLSGSYVNSTAFTTFTSGTFAAIYEVVAPWATADLMQLNTVQSADVLTVAHPTYPPYEISRLADDNWTITSVAAPEPSIDPPVWPPAPADPADVVFFKVTSLKLDTFEESLPTDPASSSTDGSPSSPLIFIWSAVTGAYGYNIYKAYSIGGPYGLIGTAAEPGFGGSFSDIGGIPDFSRPEPVLLDLFNSAGNYPSCVTYAQQRLLFGATDNNPEKIWASRIGFYKNFTVTYPLQDDNSLSWVHAGRQINRIKHMIELTRLVVFTESGEWVVTGGAQGELTPFSINPKQHTYNGSGYRPPIVIDDTALYVQALSSIVRDLTFDYQVDGYRGNDITTFARHLFEGHSVYDWDYQKIPNSIVWAARDDGVLLGCTYVREQQILAWHRHDTEGGYIENVCTIPEGSETAVYLTVRRTVSGRTVRYIERMASRFFTDVTDCVFVDSSLSYDGTNTNGSHTMDFTAPSGWEYTDDITVVSSASYFSASDVGNAIVVTDPADGRPVRFIIKSYTNATTVVTRPNRTASAALQAILTAATADWGKGVDELSGLWHLEGKDVSIFADGFVQANPHNDKYTLRTVTNGRVSMDHVHVKVVVGLPITADIETLDVDSAQTETLKGKKLRVGKVMFQLEKTRGLWVGPRPPQNEDEDFLQNLTELKVRQDEGYDDPVRLITDNTELAIDPLWSSNGRVFIRQTDPLPASILAIMPDGDFPFRQG